ncbi:MAG: dihydrolipoamide acetyltransferase family protein [Planctomycetota bacterium]|nr:dihydrolipoamide acetyltransferase family protein [Planctomycetota bacterium]
MAGVTQPKDQSHFILPDLGEGVHEAELIKWRVSVGDTVKEHETIAEMETDKALVEVPSPWNGTISELCGAEGEIILVGSVLVRYGTPETAAVAAAPAAASEAAASDEPSDGSEDAGTVVGSVSGELTVSDRFARKAPDPVEMTNGHTKALATPAVRRIAREFGIDINLVPGTGRGGRVTASDVHAHAGGTSAAPTPSAPATTSSAPTSGFTPQAVAIPADLPPVDAGNVAEVIPFRGVRRKIAEALDQSVKTAVHFTVVDEADVTALDLKRREYAKVLGAKLSLLPFVMTAICKALRVHPALNAIVDDAQSQILRKDSVNLGCAVDTEHGLMVPVIHGAETLSVAQLGQAVSQIARGCKDRTIERERLTGGTFTISNVGSYGGMFATPIINYPEVAILAVGRAKERVLAEDGRMFVGNVMPLSLSCDHRVVDGAEGARFLNTVVTLLQNPVELIDS